MLHIGDGKRDEWEFEYTARTLADGAESQRDFRRSRVEWWTAQKERVMAEVRESGVEVIESVASQASVHTTSNAAYGGAPQVRVKSDLQQKLAECQSKIASHTQAAAEYDGWVQVLRANPESRLPLTQADWLYFFGKV